MKEFKNANSKKDFTYDFKNPEKTLLIWMSELKDHTGNWLDKMIQNYY